jgi:HlyD family secretion protein
MSTTPRPVRLRWVLAALVLTAGAAGAAWLFAHPSPGGTPPASGGPPSSSVAGEPVWAQGFVDVEGGVTPLYPLQPGRVAKVLVHESDEVKEGAELLLLEDGPARLRVREAEAALAAARAQLEDVLDLPRQRQIKITQQKSALEVVRSRLETARGALKRQEKLHKEEVVGDDQVAIARDQVREVEAMERAEKVKLDELEAHDTGSAERRARAEVAVVEARLEQAKVAVNECVLRAPAAGTVLRVLVSRGEVLSGQPKQPAVMFCPRGPRIVRAEVDQDNAARVARGQPALVVDDADRGKSWPGEVARVSDWFTQKRSIALEPTRFNDLRTLECIIQLEGEPKLRIGQRVRVRIGKAPG